MPVGQRTSHHESLEHWWGTQAGLEVSALAEEDAEELGLEESGDEGRTSEDEDQAKVIDTMTVGWALLPVRLEVRKRDGQECPSYSAVRQYRPLVISRVGGDRVVVRRTFRRGESSQWTLPESLSC